MLNLLSEILELLCIRNALKAVLRKITEHNVRRISPKIVRTLPHNEASSTQGLICYHHFLYESTGLIGQSSLRKIRLSDGREVTVHPLAQDLFGEGIALLNGMIYQLTWKSEKAIVYDAATLNKVKELNYTGEGWGLTATKDYLVMSNGSSRLTFRNENFHVSHSLRITSHGIPLRHINDIEWAHGKIYANVLNSQDILEINSSTGHLEKIIDCTNLLAAERPRDRGHVLNGIAYCEHSNTFFLTGKCWERIYEVEFPS